ncbi:BnaC01g30380D [Brassica napus]|uniref:BnaC01g30380D protein n=1 Tax=Brassica napus TaxID=3708 RepID=A0A078I7E3_BRANA|nr:BnaC01g30380D [Brassica napus]
MMKTKSKALIIFFTLVLLLIMASRVIPREDGFAPPKLSPSSTQVSSSIPSCFLLSFFFFWVKT